MKITSSAFQNNSKIPSIYSCDGENVNPPLFFSNVPSNAKSLALIVDDPDAPMGTFVHWVLFNMNPSEKEITENSMTKGSTEGLTSMKNSKYVGVCPPSGTHRYFFKLYALDTMLSFSQRPTNQELEIAMKGHILEKAELIGLYSRGNEATPGRHRP